MADNKPYKPKPLAGPARFIKPYNVDAEFNPTPRRPGRSDRPRWPFAIADRGYQEWPTEAIKADKDHMTTLRNDAIRNRDPLSVRGYGYMRRELEKALRLRKDQTLSDEQMVEGPKAVKRRMGLRQAPKHRSIGKPAAQKYLDTTVLKGTGKSLLRILKRRGR